MRTTTTLEVDAVQALFEPGDELSLQDATLDAMLHVTEGFGNDAAPFLGEPKRREDLLPLGDTGCQDFKAFLVVAHLHADVLNLLDELRHKNLLTHDTLHLE